MQLTLDINFKENVLYIYDTYNTVNDSTIWLKFVATKTLLKNIYKSVCINDKYMDQTYFFKRVSKTQFKKLY